MCFFSHTPVDDIRKTVASLENPNVPVVKKRCLMKMTLGDYRKNMQAEKQRVPLGIITFTHSILN